jgi:RNA polymerase sigma-70 factor, ECF subfamily
MMNREQFASLVAAQSDDLYNYACYMLHNQEDAADLLQDTFLRCWQQRARVKPNLEQNWLWRVISRRCLDMLRHRQRSRKRFQQLDPEQLSRLPDTDTKPESDFDHHQRQQQLQKALAILPDRTRGIMIMRYYQDFDYREIAVRMSMRSGTVRVIVLRARKKMHEYMTQSPALHNTGHAHGVKEDTANPGGTAHEE